MCKSRRACRAIALGIAMANMAFAAAADALSFDFCGVGNVRVAYADGRSPGQAEGDGSLCRKTRIASRFARADREWMRHALTWAVAGDPAADEARTTADYVLEGPELVFWNPHFRGVARVPLGVRAIGDEAFKGCRGVTRIELPFGVESIGRAAFYGSGVRELFIPETVTGICERAFGSCESLADVTLPGRLRSIDRGTFAHCTGLRSASIPAGVTDIGISAFKGCRMLEEVNMPRSLRRIGYNAFRWCERLELSGFPPCLEEIGAYAFAGCSRLEALSFPASLSRLGLGCFQWCGRLIRLRFDGDAPETDMLPSLLEGTDARLRVFVRQGTRGWDAGGGRWPPDAPENMREVVFCREGLK